MGHLRLKVESPIDQAQGSLKFAEAVLQRNTQRIVTMAELECTFKKLVDDPVTPESRKGVLSAFIALALRYFLAPHGRCGPSHPSIQVALSDLSHVKEYGWCSFVLDAILSRATHAVRNLLDPQCTSVTVSGCILVLQFSCMIVLKECRSESQFFLDYA